MGDLKKMNKVIRKAKEGADESKIQSKKIDKFENLQIHGYLACDDAIFISRMVHQIYTGRKTLEQIPVYMFTDSRPLHDSIYSTKQVERKTMRHVVQIMKDAVSRGEVEKLIWVDR